MKTPKKSAVLTTAALAAAVSAHAQMTTNDVATGGPNVSLSRPLSSGGIGAGIVLGEPTGFTVKGWLTSTTAIDGAIGASFSGHTGLQLSSDYLIHTFDLFHLERGALPLYFGFGGRLDFPDHRDTRFGFRFPVGLAYEFPDAPIEAFAEIAPIIDVAHTGALRWNGGVGLRYYFH